MYIFSSQFLRSLIVVCVLVFTNFSCIPPDIKETADTQFFDLKGFLDTQVNVLEEKGFSVTKKTNLQGKLSEKKVQDIEWKDEFAFFYASDINTPQLRDRYKIEKTPKKWSFKTDEENLTVKEMEIYFENENDTSFGNVKEILILQKDKNILYENNRALRFKVANGVLEIYSINGSENVILNKL